MNLEDIIKTFQTKPSVHQLCYGLFIQEPIILSKQLTAIPFPPLGFSMHATYTANYTLTIGSKVDEAAVQHLLDQGKDAFPVVSLVYSSINNGTTEELESIAEKEFILGRRILSWASGDEITPFAYIINSEEGCQFKQVFSRSRFRQRLGFGNTGADFNSGIKSVYDTANRDEHFSFSLSLFHDALREDNPQFKIARLFNVLECLAKNIKNTENSSRKAVKKLLGLPEGVIMSGQIEGFYYKFDTIEIAGRVRDRLFHGALFKEKYLNQENQHVFYILKNHPDILIDSLISYCELEIAKWANGSSTGLKSN